MAKIYHLPPEIIAKIAAGEVIERPSFAVKELIENALDAHATDISIYIEDAGLKKIQISDNGEGMSKEDVEESWKPHTTSKITKTDTLLGIKSFGFRGEALASLAAVSTLTIKSRTSDEPIGNQIEIRNGKMVKSVPVGMPQGTTVIAENLFAYIPARKKFLKSNQTELRHILDVINHFAIVYPDKLFRLKHNNRMLLDFSRDSTREERTRDVIGSHIFNSFLPVKNDTSHLSIEGYVAKPQISSSTQSRQFLFVNNRRVTDRLISLAVKEAFGTMLETSTYPLYVLFINFPPEMVDVNVHPRKEQVAFLNNQFIFQTVKETIAEVLQSNNITFQNLSWKRIGVGTTQSAAGKVLKKTVLDKETFAISVDTTPIQINRLYILTQTKKGILLTDQHAAHERILFEKLSTEFIKQKRKQKSKQLKNPVILNLTVSEQLLLNEFRSILKKLGYTIHSAQKKLVVTHVPSLFEDRNPQLLIKQFIENVEEGIPLRKVDKISEEMIAFLACRAAFKAGDKLEESHMKTILEDLEKTPNNATCPHGRPTQINFSLDEINHLFKR